MGYDSSNDIWRSSCDLCGGLSFSEVELPFAGTALQCRDCGLVTIDRRGSGRASDAGRIHPRRSLGILKRALERSARSGARSVLLVGAASMPLAAVARQAGMQVTSIVDAGTAAPADATTYEMSIETAPFIRDQFDVIVCAGGLESFSSPASFLEKTRIWLVSGGALLLGGMNWRSLPARMRQSAWLRRYAAGAWHLLTPATIRNYADRYGYEVETIATRSSSSTGAPFLQLALLPLIVLGDAFRMGDEIDVVLIKRGVAVRPLLQRVEEDVEQAPGLAPALYTSVQREL
jgi:hypothetical protein